MIPTCTYNHEKHMYTFRGVHVYVIRHLNGAYEYRVPALQAIDKNYFWRLQDAKAAITKASQDGRLWYYNGLGEDKL